MKNLLCIMTATAFLTACGNFCDTIVTETAEIKNSTGQFQSIELCKVPYEPLTGSVSENETRSTLFEAQILQNHDGIYVVDTYAVSNEKKEGDKCSKNSTASFSSQLFLTTKSFTQFKLCRDNQEPTRVAFVNLGNACPAGTTAQAQAVTECNETVLVDPSLL